MLAYLTAHMVPLTALFLIVEIDRNGDPELWRTYARQMAGK